MKLTGRNKFVTISCVILGKYLYPVWNNTMLECPHVRRNNNYSPSQRDGRLFFLNMILILHAFSGAFFPVMYFSWNLPDSKFLLFCIWVPKNIFFCEWSDISYILNGFSRLAFLFLKTAFRPFIDIKKIKIFS